MGFFQSIRPTIRYQLGKANIVADALSKSRGNTQVSRDDVPNQSEATKVNVMTKSMLVPTEEVQLLIRGFAGGGPGCPASHRMPRIVYNLGRCRVALRDTQPSSTVTHWSRGEGRVLLNEQLQSSRHMVKSDVQPMYHLPQDDCPILPHETRASSTPVKTIPSAGILPNDAGRPVNILMQSL